MNAINRFFAVLVLLTLLGADVVFILCWAGFQDPLSFHLIWHVQGLLDQGINLSRGGPWAAAGITAAVFILALAALYVEVRSAAPERSIVLNANSHGATSLDLSAIRELVRWTAEEVDGVEQAPVVRVRRRGKELYVTGLALLNPFVKAPETVRAMQHAIHEKVSHACGKRVHVKMRSRFQDPRARRRPR
ncbi:MAG TPA: hypothetical protein VFJ58_30235 [Armatimonadota bacterium]|nr:hypothetical protein [Armatimonadota bacterium]